MTPCWGNGAQAVGHQFPTLDMVRCRRCGRKLRAKHTPLWFDAHPERQAECVECAAARHSRCPCQPDGAL